MFFRDKKNFFVFIFILIISLVFCFDLFTHNAQPATFDGPTHLTNIAQFYLAMKDGEWLPRWSDGFANYGMPIPIIAQQTTSYLGALLNFVFHNIIFSYNAVVLCGAFFSVLFLYLFLRKYTSIKAALLGSFLFHFAPYRILNIYIRGAIPEFFAGIFFPLTLIGLYEAIEKRNNNGLFLITLSVAGLLLTHPFTLLIYSFFFLPYAVYLLAHNKKLFSRISYIAMSGFLGLGLAGYYTIPLFLELKYFYYGTGNRFLPDQYLRAVNYLSPAWYYFYRGDIGTRGHFIIFGLVESLILIAVSAYTIYSAVRKNKIHPLIPITVAVGWISVFMTSKFSIPLYEHISILGKIQHPWRMISLFIYIGPIIVALLAKNWSKWVIAFFMLCIAVIRFPQLYGKNFTAIPESSYFFTTENLHGEVLNIIWTGKTESYPIEKQKPGIIAGRGIIVDQAVHNSWRKYTVDAQEQVRMVDHTFYFPGWRVYIDGVPTTIEFQDMNYRGVITYYVPKGKHTVLVRFENTKVRMFADVVSILSVAIFAAFYIWRKRIFDVVGLQKL